MNFKKWFFAVHYRYCELFWTLTLCFYTPFEMGYKTLLCQILVYCRSSVRPHHQWPINQKLFTMDVMYLHDKPGPDNCPQEVYDALVDTLEHVSEYEGYIYETGQGLRVLLRHLSIMLSHPQQRCTQDDMDIKSLTKRSPVADSGNGEDPVPISSQWDHQQSASKFMLRLVFGFIVCY